jgi:plasmid replication initiation protein
MGSVGLQGEDMESKNKKGNISVVQKNADPTLKKPVGLIHSENKLTLLQRKICNILLFNALDGINNTVIHEISLKSLCSLIGYKSKDFKLIKNSIKGLLSTVMEWNLLKDNKFINEDNLSEDAISWHASSLLAGASIEQGTVQYSYSPQIKTVLSSLEIYGRINLFVQSKFNSNYSLVLYENCIRFKNIHHTSWFTLDLFRSLMGAGKGKYQLFGELKRNIITIAVNEINLKSDIFIVPEYKKKGQFISALRFIIDENENYKPSFKRITKSSEHDPIPETSESSLLEILSSQFNIYGKQAKSILSKYELSYVVDKIELVKKSKKAENPGAYLISALKFDYNSNKSKDAKSSHSQRNGKESSIRETCEASEIQYLKSKYLNYQFDFYITHLSNLKLLDKVKSNFVENNKINKNHSFLEKEEFIKYINVVMPELSLSILAFDDFLASEVDSNNVYIGSHDERNSKYKSAMNFYNLKSSIQQQLILEEFVKSLGQSLYLDSYNREGLNNILVQEQLCAFLLESYRLEIFDPVIKIEHLAEDLID